jgi:LPXTG-motif cell wall-anchored protein
MKKYFLLFLVLVFVITLTTPVSAADELKQGLTMKIYKIIDPSLVVIKFHTDPGGQPYWSATDPTNYVVTDGSGKIYPVIASPSYFLEGGGSVEVTETFKLTFESPLPAGEYTITVSTLKDSLTEPILTYAPCSTTFTIEGDATAVTAVDESATSSPSTGDAGMIGFAIMALGGLSGLMVFRKRGK